MQMSAIAALYKSLFTIIEVIAIFAWAGVTYAQREVPYLETRPNQRLASRTDPLLVVYPPHRVEVRPSDHYEVTVSQGGRRESVFVYSTIPPDEDPEIRVSGSEWYRSRGVTYAFATFSFQGEVIIRVKKRAGTFQQVTIRPTRLAIPTRKIDDQTLEFKLRREGLEAGYKLSVEFDGQTKDRLILFADPIERKENLPDRAAGDTYVVPLDRNFSPPGGSRTVIFDAGIYRIGVWHVPQSVKHIYIAGGAYVRGALDIGKRGDVLISGRGVLSGEEFQYLACKKAPTSKCLEKPWQDAVHLIEYGGEGFRLEGITLTKPAHFSIEGWGAKNARLENFKIVGSFRYKEDGTELNSDSVVSDCFVNAMDDSFKIYFERGRINNCVVWQGANGAVFQYGWYNKNASNNVVTNVDIIHADWTWGKGVASSDTSTNNNAVFGYVPGKGQRGEIKNETYRNIRIETPVLRVFGFQLPAGQAVSNFVIEGISVPEFNRDPKWKTNYFWADGGTVDGVNLSRFMVGGKLVTKDNAFATGALELLGGAAATFNQ